MERTRANTNGKGKDERAVIRCPQCGGFAGKAGRGTKAVFPCTKCKGLVDVEYSGPVLMTSMVLKEH